MEPPRPNPRLVLALVCLPVFIGALDLTIISAVLPAVLADLTVPIQIGLDVGSWVISGYFIAYAVSMTFMGRVSDLWGRRQVYLLCLAIFFAGSWLVAASPGWPSRLAYPLARLIEGQRPDKSLVALYSLIFGRVIQAFGAGAMVPVSMALVADLFPPESRSVPLGVVGAVDTAGWVLGHLYGGIVVQYYSWPYLFWFNLPIVAIMFVLTWRALRNLHFVPAEGGVDWLGAGLIATALLGLNIALGSEETGSAQPNPAAAAKPHHHILWGVAAAVSFALFLAWQRRVKHPLLNLKIFAIRNLSAAGGLNLLVGFCIMVGLLSVPLFINAVGSSTTKQGAIVSGYLLSAFTVPMALASIPGGWLSERLGYRASVTLGVVVALAGFGLMSRWELDMAKQAVGFVIWLNNACPGAGAAWREGLPAFAGLCFGWAGQTFNMLAGLIVAGVGLGITIAPIGTAVINAVSESERGMAAALVIILRLIGMTISTSAVTNYGLHRLTVLSNRMLAGVDGLDLSQTARVGLLAVTQITDEMAIIAAVVCAAAIVPSVLLARGDASPKAQA